MLVETDVRRILAEAIRPNGKLGSFDEVYVDYDPKDKTALVDGHATAEQLEAIAWWMRNKTTHPE